MEAPEERLTRLILDYLYRQFPTGNRHIKRMAASIGPAIWKIHQATGQLPRLSSSRQLRFTYKGRNFKGRYRHEDNGRLELVETVGNRDGNIVVTINGLDDVMRLNLRSVLDTYTK